MLAEIVMAEDDNDSDGKKKGKESTEEVAEKHEQPQE